MNKTFFAALGRRNLLGRFKRLENFRTCVIILKAFGRLFIKPAQQFYKSLPAEKLIIKIHNVRRGPEISVKYFGIYVDIVSEFAGYLVE